MLDKIRTFLNNIFADPFERFGYRNLGDDRNASYSNLPKDTKFEVESTR